jgi:hypothetical protein
VLAAALLAPLRAQQGAAAGVTVDADDIGGVVTSANGPEAGVWVIAETDDLSTPLKKIVVTDDEGRYLLPDMPEATYRVWVRGYGLVDSEPVNGAPGDTVALTAVLAPDAQAAAQYYPANYWYSLLEVPEASEFPGTGPEGNGIDPAIETQHEWISRIKAGCNVCHQLGNTATREIPAVFTEGRTSVEAWDLRVQSGQDGNGMSNAITGLGRQRALEMFADWTDRIAAGEVPAEAPPRPQGVERNLVLTMWDWGAATTFAHDELSTDKRNPTANAGGPIFGVDWGNDAFLILDPQTHEVEQLRVPVLDPETPFGKAQTMPVPSAYWGSELYWDSRAIPNHAAMDSQGRVWMSGRFRTPQDQPEFCRAHPSATLAPMETGFRQMQYFDPETREFHQVDICFDTHHVAFANDADETIYGNGPFAGAIGWVKTRVLEETGDVAAAQGWCQGYFDIDGDGRVDPAVDRPIPMGGVYSVIPNNADGSVWGAVLNPVPGKIVRIDPNTCVGEAYEPPFGEGLSMVGYTPRGVDIDDDGVIWTGLAGSGHLASFDRRRCTVLGGEEATTGQHCPEGWTLYRYPGPSFRNAPEEIATGFIYYNFVDRFDTLGLGANVPVATGTTSDSLLALVDGEWVDLRVPYPMGFFTRGLDGRIDDPDAGWKGRAIYANYGPNAVWHIEGGLGTLSKVVRFQIRPDPLAR